MKIAALPLGVGSLRIVIQVAELPKPLATLSGQRDFRDLSRSEKSCSRFCRQSSLPLQWGRCTPIRLSCTWTATDIVIAGVRLSWQGLHVLMRMWPHSFLPGSGRVFRIYNFLTEVTTSSEVFL